MKRTEHRPVRRGSSGLGAAADLARQAAKDILLFGAVAAYLLSGLGRVDQLSGSILPWVAALFFVSGCLHVVRSRWAGRKDGVDRQLARALRRGNRHLGFFWIGAGVALLIFGVVVRSPLAVGAVGAPVSLAIYARGLKLASGGAGYDVARTLLVAACVFLVYTAIVVAQIAPSTVPNSDREEGTGPEADPGHKVHTGPSDGGGVLPGGAPPTYAELCPQLPDPLDIEHGLGKLFRSAGAVKGGCGSPAVIEAGVDSVWVSEGICGEEMRSLAVASPGYEPVLLFGEPARLARIAASHGDLLFAGGAEPGEGEVDVIGTRQGTYYFARPSPSEDPGDEDAESCKDVGGVARTFTKLSSAAAQMWLWHVTLHGWAWPIDNVGSSSRISFLDDETDRLEATADCDEGGSCHLDGPGEHLSYSGIPTVTLTDLESYMPEPIE